MKYVHIQYPFPTRVQGFWHPYAGKRGMVTCAWEGFNAGFAFCSPSDNFSRREGRRRASKGVIWTVPTQAKELTFSILTNFLRNHESLSLPAWLRLWFQLEKQNLVAIPDKPSKTPRQLEIDEILAKLFAAEVLHTNTHWWRKDWPEGIRDMWGIFVCCNDIFEWGSADSEEISYSEIRDLYDHYCKDPHWGPAIWCIKKRGIMPQPPVEKLIREQGIWDLYSLNLMPYAEPLDHAP